jgi:Tol biopolymer transport system component
MSSRSGVPVTLLLAFIGSSAAAAPLWSQEPPDSWDPTRPRGETRLIDFTTEEGTWMSVDISPDGQWIVFDLLGHVYRVPATGGTAEALTQSSGIAVNFQPRYSPDGRTIAFVSDRRGQNNLWLMDADGSNPRPVFLDPAVRVVEPAWTGDGQYIMVRRQVLGERRTSALWMYHRDGGNGVRITDDDVTGASWPAPSADGRYVYFHVSTPGETVAWTGMARDALQGSYNLRRLELENGEITSVTSGGPSRQYRLSSGGAFAGEVSPDGRWLAFARQIPDGTISWKGHEYGPRTALWLKDLESGAERIIMDPIERDMAEETNTLRVLPGYSWTRDGRSIVIAQGGKLRRIEVESGRVETIPFTARVQRTISEQAYAPFRLSDEPFPVRFLRWHTASPDGRLLAFQAVGRVWVMDATEGEPRRLTKASFEPFEYAPAWSPDGRWLAFASVDEVGLGHLWKAPAAGGEPVRLTDQTAEYMHPVWHPGGHEILAVRGAGASTHQRTMAHNPWFDIIRVPADGGDASFVRRIPGPTLPTRTQFVRPSYGPEGRIFYPQLGLERSDSTALVSVRADGSDRRVHMTFPYADEIVVSPGGDRVAFNEGDNIYLMPFPEQGAAANPVHVDRTDGTLPVTRLSRAGGILPRWRNATTVEFGSGPRYFAFDAELGSADTITIDLKLPRARADGVIALTGARIVTLEDARVIESGTIVVENGRIACVGECSSAGADRVEDVTGKTIIPGFIDMHSHHFREYRGIIPKKAFEASLPLAYGVTTSMDNSMWSQDVFPAAELIEAGELIGPRTFSTGDPLYAGNGPRQNDLTDYAVTADEVERLQSWGAVSLKQYLQPRREQRQWITDLARERKLMVTSQGADLISNLTMIMDGQTGWEHALTYAPLYGDVTKFFGRANAVYSPTFNTRAGPWNDEYFFGESDVWRNEKLRRWLPWQQLVPHTRRRMLRPRSDYFFPFAAQGLADIISEGGHGSIGGHGQQHGLGSHWEIWMAAEALGAMGALEVASNGGAYFLGAERDLGSISTGKLADLIVLNANPLDDVRNTENILYVMKDGVLYDGETLDEIWPRRREYGARPWVNPGALESGPRPVDYWDRRPPSNR